MDLVNLDGNHRTKAEMRRSLSEEEESEIVSFCSNILEKDGRRMECTDISEFQGGETSE